MTRLTALRYVFKHIRTMARDYRPQFERTKSKEIARTYGLKLPNGEPDAEIVKRIKARFRCELSCEGMGK
jgi:hypothetical protein